LVGGKRPSSLWYIGTDLKLRTTLSCSEKVPAVVTRRQVERRQPEFVLYQYEKNCANHILGPLEKKHPFREEAQEYITVANRFLMAQQRRRLSTIETCS
jgi:hypothetical protein